MTMRLAQIPTPFDRSPRLRTSRHAAAALLASALLVVASACEDAATDPLEGLVAEETDAAALALGFPLPTPDHPVLDGTDGPGGSALADWRGSWALAPAEGRRVREPLYRPLSVALDRVLGADRVAAEVERLGEGVNLAQSLPHEELPTMVVDGIQRAAGSRAAAADALRSRDGRRALEYVLRGSDALREVGPEAVARTVVREAETLFRRVSGDAAYSERDRERMSRLVRGSRQALDEGAWVLAIRRAYYAKGLARNDA